MRCGLVFKALKSAIGILWETYEFRKVTFEFQPFDVNRSDLRPILPHPGEKIPNTDGGYQLQQEKSEDYKEQE